LTACERIPSLERRFGLDEPRFDAGGHGDRCLAAAIALLRPQLRGVVEPRDTGSIQVVDGPRSIGTQIRFPLDIRHGVPLVGEVAVEHSVVLTIGVFGVLLHVREARGTVAASTPASAKPPLSIRARAFATAANAVISGSVVAAMAASNRALAVSRI